MLYPAYTHSVPTNDGNAKLSHMDKAPIKYHCRDMCIPKYHPLHC